MVIAGWNVDSMWNEGRVCDVYRCVKSTFPAPLQLLFFYVKVYTFCCVQTPFVWQSFCCIFTV